MKQTLRMAGLIAALLVLLDVAVAGVLMVAGNAGGKGAALVRYFEYGRSVPGKLDRWIAAPGLRDNLFDVAWIPDTLAASQEAFAAEGVTGTPVVRAYGMSFADQILSAAAALEPSLTIDMHGGPAAPPNFSYEMFLQDRPNRRAGDIVVFGILSSSTPAMAALSNRTWSFEQPAPFTYPVFLPAEGDGLRRIAPLVQSADGERALRSDPAAAEAWAAQLAGQDRLYTAAAFAWDWLDISPFARLVRRSLAISAVEQREADLISPDSDFPASEVLQRMIAGFVRTAREDSQIPVVFLIQSRNPADLNLFSLAGPAVQLPGLLTLVTADHVSPRDPAAFVGDGHYTRAANAVFAQALLDQLRSTGALK
ncbi:hypothetical protein [Roseobacter sp. S98]|uniref:hypothetical protein n=1 Tax=Roseobacter algicola (ex Choi et al. 2025) (nom. illeg.) TaxID=3092138 RepID=UPI0035C6EDB9